MVETKYCSQCDKIKPVTDFSKRSSAKNGLSTYCKKCLCDRSKEYCRKNSIKNTESFAQPSYTTKVCSRCKKVSAVSEFGYRRASKDGIMSFCKKCAVKRSVDFYKNNSEYRERCKKSQSIYNKENSHIGKRRLKIWLQNDANKKKMVAYRKKWIEKNKEYHKKYNKLYRTRWKDPNPEKKKQYRKVYNVKNKDNINKKANIRLAKSISELKDSYIKRILVRAGFPKDSLTHDLIEIKKIDIKIKRKIYNHSKE